MGRVIARAGAIPDKVVTSSAVRARTTAELAADAGRWRIDIEATDGLYDASTVEVLQYHVQTQPDSLSSVMLVGHEPTWSQLASILSGGGAVRLATATAVAIDFHVTSWSAVQPGAGHIEWMLSPRLFESGWDID